ncbi:MAG TPA: hypothetical protein VLV78_02045 [Thermoanaerobaculia bacterium]|nr:hypothetical protein [Thermoanaerobaculia bacterium]
MKRLVPFVIVLALAGNAAGQDSPPDYSREKLLRLFADEPQREKVEPRVQFGIGYVDFKALNMRWRVNYLPIMLPLYGSVPWTMNGAFGSMPDPFTMTGTEIPYTPRTWRQVRDMNAELKRIERTERAKEKPKATVTTHPE